MEDIYVNYFEVRVLMGLILYIFYWFIQM